MRKILYLLFTLFLSSCYDNTLVEPCTQKTNLKIIVYGRNGELLGNARIYINKESKEIITDSTGSNGEYNTVLTEGIYYIKVRANAFPFYYSAEDYTLLIGGIDKIKKYRPFDNIGKASFYVQNKEMKPVSGLNITILSKYFAISGLPFDEYMKYGYLTGTTDSTGRITFDNLPLGNQSISVVYYKKEPFLVYGFTNIGSISSGHGYYQIYWQ